MVEFFDGRIALTEKKNATERKPTPKQVENEGFKADILAWMEKGVEYAVADIAKGVPSLDASGVKSQRVTALLTQLKDAGLVTRTEVKGKAFYALA
jgi:DNA-binding transcriptional ArsR family regulator